VNHNKNSEAGGSSVIITGVQTPTLGRKKPPGNKHNGACVWGCG